MQGLATGLGEMFCDFVSAPVRLCPADFGDQRADAWAARGEVEFVASPSAHQSKIKLCGPLNTHFSTAEENTSLPNRSNRPSRCLAQSMAGFNC